MSGFSRITSKIVPFFQKYPVLKSSVQAGGLMCLGDLISQTVVERTDKIEWTRTARFGFIGFVIVGPCLFKWYGVLERFIKFSKPGTTAFSKMAVDQLTFAPTLLYGFFWINCALQGMSTSEIKHNISTHYLDVIIANYKLWPAVQIVNFYFIPLPQRVLFVQTVALFWNTYLAWKVNRSDSSSITSNEIRQTVN